MDERVALVTGGTRGIGAAISRRLASEGYLVYINYRRETPETEHLLDGIRASGGRAELIRFDVSTPQDVQTALEGLKHSKLDLLVHNAGFLKDELIYKIDRDTWHQVLETNYFGPVRLFEAAGELLSRSASPAVVSIGSISGVKPRAGQAAYAVSKAMIIEWTRRMAELNKNKLHFYSVSPGPVYTEMIRETKWGKDSDPAKRLPLGRFIEPDEIAEIVYLLDSTRCVTNGFNIVYDGGFINTVKE